MNTENNKKSVIALDVGGSSVESGLVKPDGIVEFACYTPLDSQALKEKVLRVLVQIIQSFLPKVSPNELLGVAIGFPGPFNYKNGLCLIQGQSKFDNLYQVNLRDELSKFLDLNIRFFFAMMPKLLSMVRRNMALVKTLIASWASHLEQVLVQASP